MPTSTADAQFVDGTLWGLRNTGQNGGVAGVDIDAVRAWDVTTGSTNVIVAVIDTGIRYTHQDLHAQMWVNPGEIAGNGIDDDGDGYVDDVHGIDAIAGTGDPIDNVGHGTHCAGTIGAAANDGNPIVGVAWNVRLMACKFMDSSGGAASDMIKCVEYAVSKGARILSNSYGSSSYSQAQYDAIAAAGQQGALFVVAAGNEFTNNDGTPCYPSGYALDNIISVAAIDRTGGQASFSNYGSKTVHLGAPGVSIYSCFNSSDSAYATLNGTSMATPHVAGVAALVLAQFPGIPVEDLRDRIINTTTPTTALQSTTVTGGRVDAYQALTAAATGTLNVTASLGSGNSFVMGRPVALYAHVTDLLGVTNATVTGSAPGLPPITFTNNGVAPDRSAGDAYYSATITAPAGVTSLAVTITAGAPGKTGVTKTFTYPVLVNDDFANRIQLTGANPTASGNNVSASAETGEPDHYTGCPATRSVWWTWTAPSNGTVLINSSTSINFLSLVGVHTGTAVSALTAVPCDVQYWTTTWYPSGKQTYRTDATFFALGGTAYQIAVDGALGMSGDIGLALTFTPDAAPAFSPQPADQTVQLGDNASIPVSVTGSPTPTLQWQVSLDNGTSWTNLSDSSSYYGGVTTGTLYIISPPLSLSGSQYRCVATNRVTTTPSNAATLKVKVAARVITLAGTGSVGSADGYATVMISSFNLPNGAAVDSSGNVYVADTHNNKIRKVSTAGVVTTLAGSGSSGSTDGTGTAAMFNGPMGVAVDASGNVYVADENNNKIRKVTSAGVVTTFAGSGSFGAADGTGTAASFENPMGVAVDASGNVYVADSSNNKIRKVTSAGVVTTLAGSGSWGSTDAPGTAASFECPAGVTVDASSNVYVADTYNNKIRKVTSAGVVTTLAGSGSWASTDGTGTAASFYFPSGVTADASGNVYVADSSNNKIRKVTSAGVVTTFAGSGSYGSTDETGTAASFDNPTGVAVDLSGNVYVADENNNKIRKVTSARVVTTFAGSGMTGSNDGLATGIIASFNGPSGAAVDASGNVYVADQGNHNIRKISTAGLVTTFAGSGSAGATNGTGTAASFNYPVCVAADTSGNLYVAEAGNHDIRKVSPVGVVTTLAGSGSSGWADGTGTAASFNRPWGMAVDASGNVFVADSHNNMIRKVTSAGVVTTFAGSGTAGSAEGTGTAASFNNPDGVAVDASGNVYVGDLNNNKIRKISPTGVVTTLAGSGVVGATDGTGTAASFDSPVGVALDTSGNVYVADDYNYRIRKISPAGVVTTLAGSGSYGSADGLGTAASFNYPDGVVVDASDNVYVTDWGNNNIRKIIQPAKTVPVITWAAPAAIPYGTPLSSTQLNATADAVGNMVYTPAAGTVLSVGSYSLQVTFTPTDTDSYTTATSDSATLTVNSRTPVITWPAPAAITYPAALSGHQLNATANVPGHFVYSPAAGTVLSGGAHTLHATFTPTDTAITPARRHPLF